MTPSSGSGEAIELESRLDADRREERARRDAELAREAEVDAKIAERLDNKNRR